MKGHASAACLCVVATMAMAPTASLSQSQPASANDTLTAVAGIKVGHHTLTERSTGCTVVLMEQGVTAGVDVRGGAPGTRDTALLDPVNSVEQVHAIVLSGGSAFGLDTASGVMRYLDERRVGMKFPAPDSAGTSSGAGAGAGAEAINVPIVSAAVLIDLWVGGKPSVRPDASCGYQAAQHASAMPVREGTIGAGAGATVGKVAGVTRAMKGGLGSAAITTSSGLIVAAMVAVNARGDVIDPATGRVIAGVRTPDGKRLADARVLLRAGGPPAEATSGAPTRAGDLENTTLGVIATNAKLTKTQAAKVAQMAQDGFARAISPIHTPSDGDTVFALATGALEGEPDIGLIGALAAEVMADAIVRGIRAATGLPGIPASRDLKN